MGLFDHQHRWLPKTGLNPVTETGKAKPTGGLLLEACPCGAIRQIEFFQGVAPTIFITPAPAKDKAS